MMCLNCGKQLSYQQKKYCSNQCQKDYEYKQYIQRWKNKEEDGLKGKYGLSNYIRKYLLEKVNFKCEQCGWGEINPFTQQIALEIHHIDGNYTHNQEENLQVLCPNCHSLTANYRNSGNHNGRENRKGLSGRKQNFCIDCGKEISLDAIRCHQCEANTRKTDIPLSREELKKLIRTTSFTQIGKDHLVTDNAVRKWCDKYNLPRTKKEINQYSDIEWEKI